MLKSWQFNILFFVGVGGAVLMLIGPSVGLNISSNPTAVTGIGAILTYVLAQRKTIIKKAAPPEESTTEKEVAGDGTS